MSDNLALYIHIPFCRGKCPYCDFFSLRGDTQDYNSYIVSLKEAIIYWSEKIDKKVDTIYIGGGTPSVLKAEQVADIINTIKSHFKVTENAEITMEANPKSALNFDFSIVKEAGLNRMSLGIQSANKNELKILGRAHNNDDIKATVKNIKSSGINNISLDLMLGIPEQTIESLKNSIDFCCGLDVEHISVYILKIEENTYFYNNRDKYNFPDEEATADLYLFAVDYLEQKGFNQYEISNFSKTGYESKHNLKYWNLEDYLGIGPAAHSFLNGKRFYYNRSIEDFSNNKIIDDGTGGNESEYIMLQLRLTKGLNLDKYKEAFGEYPDKDFFDKVKKYCNLGFMSYDNNTIKFTKNGFLLSNSILSELI